MQGAFIDNARGWDGNYGAPHAVDWDGDGHLAEFLVRLDSGLLALAESRTKDICLTYTANLEPSKSHHSSHDWRASSLACLSFIAVWSLGPEVISSLDNRGRGLEQGPDKC